MICLLAHDMYNKQGYKVTLRKALHVPKKLALHIPVMARRVQDLKKFFHHSFKYDSLNQKVETRRRYLSCVCMKCQVNQNHECENQHVGGWHPMY